MSAPKVLIADDDHDLLESLWYRCRRLGLNVRTVDNSLDLLNAMYRDRPDVACVDVQMPLGTGLNACEMLSADPELARVPLIIMTGKSDSRTIVRCWDLNAYYVLKCPDIWPRLEPLFCEILGLPANKATCDPWRSTAETAIPGQER